MMLRGVWPVMLYDVERGVVCDAYDVERGVTCDAL
jgi:hypothetical protein